jgi:dihydroxyacetone kinase-like protein
MELGVGIHGEPGRRKVQFAKADSIAKQLVDAIVGDLANPKSGEALLLINGFGGSPLIELYVMYNATRRLLEGRGVRVVRSLVGNFVTSLDMVGCSVTVCLLDDELARLWDSPVHTAALRW